MPRKGAKLFALRGSAPLEHESLRIVMRERYCLVSLWRATQIGIRCLEMWIFCLFLFNTFVFVKLYRLLPDLQKHLFALFPFRRAIRRLAPQGGKALRVALCAPLEHESLRTTARVILSSFLMARHARRQSSSRCAAALRSSTNPCALSCASDPLRFPYGAP